MWQPNNDIILENHTKNKPPPPLTKKKISVRNSQLELELERIWFHNEIKGTKHFEHIEHDMHIFVYMYQNMIRYPSKVRQPAIEGPPFITKVIIHLKKMTRWL